MKVTNILKKYQLTAQTIFPTQTGYRNKIIPILLTNQQKVCLIFYKKEPGILQKIKNSHAVANYLANHHFPSRQTYHQPAKILKIVYPAKNKIAQTKTKTTQFVSLYHYLPGSTISWEDYTRKQLKLLGQTMARMHQQLRCFQDTNQKQISRLPKQLTLMQQQLTQLTTYLQQPEVKSALTQKLNLTVKLPQLTTNLSKTLNSLGQLPARKLQPLHLDFVRSNILFQAEPSSEFGLEISGVLDFEKTAIGPPVIDLARTLAFLLVDCQYKPAIKIRKYFLHSGYHKRGQAALPNPQLINPLIKFFLSYDFYKFLKHNPYQFLQQNQHFVRTCQKLIKLNLLEA